jgi:hypothetical protein
MLMSFTPMGRFPPYSASPRTTGIPSSSSTNFYSFGIASSFAYSNKLGPRSCGYLLGVSNKYPPCLIWFMTPAPLSLCVAWSIMEAFCAVRG